MNKRNVRKLRCIPLVLLVMVFMLPVTALANGQGPQTTLLTNVTWERTSNYDISAPTWHSIVPRPYYGDDTFPWTWTSDDAHVWNTTSGSYRWFYTPDYRPCSPPYPPTHYWFRTTLTSPNGGNIIGVEIFDQVYNDIVGINDAAYLYVDGVEVNATGNSSGSSTYHADGRVPMILVDHALVAGEDVLGAKSHELAILYEEACDWGGLGQLAILVTTGPADTDNDGVMDDVDNCIDVANPNQEDFDNDGLGDACDPDDDDDSIVDEGDLCVWTMIPESVPTVELNPNHWALVDDDFIFDTIIVGNGGGPGRSYTTTDTKGCSCEQIITLQGLGEGHTKQGCSISAMDDWIALVNP